MERVGKRIKMLREEKGWSQEELGERIGGVGKSFVSKLENGHKKINLEHIKKISSALGVDMSDLLSEEERIAIGDGEWVYLFDELKKQGLSAGEVREMVDIARKYIKKD